MPYYDTVVGVDPSLVGTGVCRMRFKDTLESIKVDELFTIQTKPTKDAYHRMPRLMEIERLVDQTIPMSRSGAFMMIEAYAFAAIGAGATTLHELGGMLRHRFQTVMVPWVEIAPVTVKRFGCGKGNAKKDQLMLAVFQRHGHLLEGTGKEFRDSNQTDAFVLALMGVYYALWRKHGLYRDKEHLKMLKSLDIDRFYQLGYDSRNQTPPKL
jgi:crossover junction endodeoxyribonuclease RuvC